MSKRHTGLSKLDHSSQVCRVGETYIVNAVGTQGLGSAAYWWARLFGTICRNCYYALGNDHGYIFTYADDLDIIAYGSQGVK